MNETEKKDEEFMRKALAEAQAAFDEDEIPVGAVIVCQGRIISRAHNLTEMLHDVTAHAEMQAITAGANMLHGHLVFRSRHETHLRHRRSGRTHRRREGLWQVLVGRPRHLQDRRKLVWSVHLPHRGSHHPALVLPLIYNKV